MSWLTTTPAPAEAPAALVARQGAEVIIRHSNTDTHLPWVIWHALTAATRAGALDHLDAEWTVWSSSGGRSRRDGGDVVLAYGYLSGREARLPVDVWQAVAVAIRAGRMDQLPHAS
ncbi:hypothetical protein [Frankia sp. AgB32]|uniref:hypothetical protein n=1 Tax=Frankia sp. AgB32 TaxID=631119 RepID=UPI00200DDA9C|nr:hypothetical protein [Frankia sp. AgB32]MCK9897662.1 hypothetical protein [Frankia sp. AgB32]